ncbi:MAG: HlyD family efflux transporter periplasmic adaptor subunit [Christensenellales bacterium]|jgi:putative membrane fusion protein
MRKGFRMPRRRKVRLRPRFYVLLAFIIVAVAGLIIMLDGNGELVTVQNGTVAFEKQVDAIVVRNEQVYTAEDYGKIVINVAEGERIAKDTKVAELYKWGYNDKVLDDLLQIQQQIKDYQENNILKNIIVEDLETLDSEIAAKIKEIAAAIQTGSGVDLLKLEQQLKTYMSDRQMLLKAKTNPDSTLEGYYSKEDQLNNRIAEWKVDVLAEASGVISFYFDGAEEYLSSETLNSLTRLEIDEILKIANTRKLVSAEAAKPLYRLVDNFKWYAAIIAPPGQLEEMRADMKYSMTFEGYYDRPYEGRVISVRRLEDDSNLITLEILEDIGPLLGARQVLADIKRDYTGLKVPATAITKKDDKTGVYMDADGEKVFIECDVVVSDGENAIVTSPGLVSGSKVYTD